MVKIKFVDTEDWFDEGNNNIIRSIYTHADGYKISNNPDILFYMSNGVEHYKYSGCVKFFFSKENVAPDFGQCDYAIGNLNILFGDRYMKLKHSVEEVVMIKDHEEYSRLDEYIQYIFSNQGKIYDKDPLHFSIKMNIPSLSAKDIVRSIIKVQKHASKNCNKK